MGMTGGRGVDPKAMGEMLDLRAEMTKAMADVVPKHAKRMQQAAPSR